MVIVRVPRHARRAHPVQIVQRTQEHHDDVAAAPGSRRSSSPSGSRRRLATCSTGCVYSAQLHSPSAPPPELVGLAGLGGKIIHGVIEQYAGLRHVAGAEKQITGRIVGPPTELPSASNTEKCVVCMPAGSDSMPGNMFDGMALSDAAALPCRHSPDLRAARAALDEVWVTQMNRPGRGRRRRPSLRSPSAWR